VRGTEQVVGHSQPDHRAEVAPVVEHEARVHRVAPDLDRRVALDHHRAQIAQQLDRARGAAQRGVEDDGVVRDHDARHGLTGQLAAAVRHARQQGDAHGRVPDDVVPERHVGDLHPRHVVLVAHGLEEDREADLLVRPVVLEHVPLEQDALAALDLEQVLDAPHAAPAHRARDVVAPDLDVARDEAGDPRRPAAEEQHLVAALDVVVLDLVRARAVPGGDALGLVLVAVAVGEVGVDHGRAGAVERDAAAHVERRRAVDVRAREDDAGRHHR
jgi:hypothetical protein